MSYDGEVRFINRIIDSHLKRFPSVDRAYRFDAQFSAHIKTLHQILSVTDRAMRGEGLPEASRIVVIEAVLAATVGAAEEALQRIDNQAQLIADIRREPWRLG